MNGLLLPTSQSKASQMTSPGGARDSHLPSLDQYHLLSPSWTPTPSQMPASLASASPSTENGELGTSHPAGRHWTAHETSVGLKQSVLNSWPGTSQGLSVLVDTLGSMTTRVWSKGGEIIEAKASLLTVCSNAFTTFSSSPTTHSPYTLLIFPVQTTQQIPYLPIHRAPITRNLTPS